jgi:beta-glucanase (GH16 family)
LQKSAQMTAARVLYACSLFAIVYFFPSTSLAQQPSENVLAIGQRVSEPSAQMTIVLPPFAHKAHGWNRTFFDDFKKPQLGSCWQTSYTGGVHTLEGNAEAEWYAQLGDATGYNPFSIRDGILSISAIPTPASAHLPTPFPYLSGMIMSDGCFSQTYGYFEIRAKVPVGKGLWPAFWLLPISHQWPPEIDVFEMFGAPNSRREGGVGWVHTGTVGGGETAFNNWHQLPINQYTEFHRYGVLWSPERMSIYVDGKLVTTQPTPTHFHQPMYMIANLAVGGKWPELPDPQTSFPATMQIDNIQAWQYQAWKRHE